MSLSAPSRSGTSGAPSLLSREGALWLSSPPGDVLLLGAFLLFCWGLSLLPAAPAGKVFALLEDAAAERDSGYLFLAAGLLVLINTLRAVLLYVGWFFAADGLAGYFRRGPRCSLGIAAVAIPLSYSLTSVFFSGTSLHFGMPALFGIATVLLLQYLVQGVAGQLNRALVLVLLLFSFQWLDVIPLLTPYGFGRGEISMAVKTLGEVLEKEHLLSLLGGIAFATLLAAGGLTAELLLSWERQIRQLRHIRSQEQELTRLREEQLRARSDRETKQLVHDLKRPLTAILGLADVMRASAESPVVRKHLGVVQQAGESMEHMVREILHSECRRKLSAGEVLDYTLSQGASLPFHKCLRRYAAPHAREAQVEVNLIRFSRALINLLDNAFRAAPPQNPRVEISLLLGESTLLFRVEDNGPGFPGPEAPGLSGWNSTGLGLAFVREVVEKHRGTLTFEAPPEGGTRCVIALPRIQTREVSP